MKDYTFLSLFPVPRRYHRIPGMLAFALVAAMVILALNEKTLWAFIALAVSILLLLAVYWVRGQQKKEWERFFEQENKKLLQIKGAEGPAQYITQQEATVKNIRNPELKAFAQLNLGAGYLANAEPDRALALLSAMRPLHKLTNDSEKLLYYTHQLNAHIQMKDVQGAEAAYQLATETLEDVSAPMKVAFMPLEIQYQLLKGNYQQAFNQLEEVPVEGIDEASLNLLTAMRAAALHGLGETAKAKEAVKRVAKHNLLPSTRAMLPVIGD